MKSHLLFALTLVAALSVPFASAVAAPTRASQNSLLSYYDMIPGRHFASFGGVNRRSLLKRKGAIVDYKNRFIEIPGSADPEDGDLYVLQIKLFPRNADEAWVAVSRAMWNQNRTPGTLNFYHGHPGDVVLREPSKDFFPYKLQKTSIAFENAYLPRQGLTIKIRIPESDSGGFNFTYNRKAKFNESFWVRSETAPN